MMRRSENEKRRPFCQTAGVFFLLLLFLAAGFLAAYLSGTRAGTASVSPAAVGYPTVIIDAGHGGEDGGAVGVNRVLEKDLNLTVALQLSDLLRVAGVPVILTRTEDRMLYGEEGNRKGRKKEFDLKNRLRVAKEHPDAIFVSIHMNNFPEAKYHGLQVYYAGRTEGSRALAEAIQRAVVSSLQPENKREVQEATSAIYLLDGAVGRAVLVECGFLSNPEECARLCEKDYQKRLCFSLFCGIMEYINQTGGWG